MNRVDIFVSAIVPADGGGDSLLPGLRKLAQVMKENFASYEILVVDDGSADGTVASLGRLLGELECLRVIRLSKKHGWELAVSAGLDSVIGDFIAILDPRVDPVELIPGLVLRSRQGEDILTGVPEGRENLRPKGLARRLFHWYLAKYADLEFLPNATGFQVLSRQAVNAIVRYRDKNRRIRLLPAMTGYENAPFYYTPLIPLKRHGASLQDAIEIIVGNTVHPLRIVSRAGLVICLFNLVYLAYIVAIYLFKRDVMEGWTTTSLFNVTMFFFLFLFLSILGEYIGKLLQESADRPPYIVMEERNSSVLIGDGLGTNVLHESERTE